MFLYYDSGWLHSGNEVTLTICLRFKMKYDFLNAPFKDETLFFYLHPLDVFL